MSFSGVSFKTRIKGVRHVEAKFLAKVKFTLQGGKNETKISTTNKAVKIYSSVFLNSQLDVCVPLLCRSSSKARLQIQMGMICKLTQALFRVATKNIGLGDTDFQGNTNYRVLSLYRPRYNL